jgi:hypothetical protein
MWKALACSALKGAFADLSRGLFGVLGLVKTTVRLGFTLAAYNLDSIRSFKAKHGLDDQAQVVERPKQRRSATLGGVDGNSRTRPRSPAQVARRPLIQTPADRARARLQDVLDRQRGAVRDLENAERSSPEDTSTLETLNRAPARDFLNTGPSLSGTPHRQPE